MKHFAIMAIAALSAWSAGASSFAQNCPSGTFEMYCRGPLALQVDGVVTDSGRGDSFIDALFFLQGSTRAAGAIGADLRQGTCSWADRPFNEAERRATTAVMRLAFSGRGDESDRAVHYDTVMAAAHACNYESDCRMVFCARANGATQFWWEPKITTIPVR